MVRTKLRANKAELSPSGRIPADRRRPPHSRAAAYSVRRSARAAVFQNPPTSLTQIFQQNQASVLLCGGVPKTVVFGAARSTALRTAVAWGTLGYTQDSGGDAER